MVFLNNLYPYGGIGFLFWLKVYVSLEFLSLNMNIRILETGPKMADVFDRFARKHLQKRICSWHPPNPLSRGMDPQIFARVAIVMIQTDIPTFRYIRLVPVLPPKIVPALLSIEKPFPSVFAFSI